MRRAAALASLAGAGAGAGPVVDTKLGPVLGAVQTAAGGQLVNTFRGVPFAADTGGANRFRAPQPRQPWGPGPLNATMNGPGCRQPHHNPDVPCGGHNTPGTPGYPRCESEDCLNVNIYCPAEASPDADGYPVMFWIYGGAYNEGMNWGPLNLYDGTEMAARGQVCVVATNYRLGVLGFLVTGEQAGNQAFLDQRAAMEWTRDNIRAFGGNPGSVTLWGESAGAMSVGLHLVSPRSAGLFHRAIMESNVGGFQYQLSPAQKTTYGRKFSKLSNCSLSDAACLSGLDVEQVVGWGAKAEGDVTTTIIDRILEGGHIVDAFAMQWAPVVDGVEIPDQPLHLLAKGAFNKVPVLIGTNQDEGATFIYDGVKTWLPEALFPTINSGLFGNDGDKVTKFYQNASKGWKDARDSLSYVLTDWWFKCASERFAAAAADAGQSAFVYRYQHVISFPEIFPKYGLPEICEKRTCHASEIPFVFHNTANYSMTTEEGAMADEFTRYWTAFARNGDPNKPGPAGAAKVQWPEFSVASGRVNLRLSVPSDIAAESTRTGQPGTLPSAGVCDFFDKEVGYDH